MKRIHKKGQAQQLALARNTSCFLLVLHYILRNFLFYKKETPPKKEVFLKKALLDAQQSLQDAYNGLSNVNEPDLIDSYIYELNAANLRYQVILRDYRSLQGPKPPY